MALDIPTPARRRAQQMLNTAVIALFDRAAQDPAERERELGNMLVIDRARDAERVLREHDTFHKDYALLEGLGESRFNLNGERWVQFRNNTQPLYAAYGRPAKRDAVAAIYLEELERVDPDEPATLERAFGLAALRVFFAALNVSVDVEPFYDTFADLRLVAGQLQYQTWCKGRDPDFTLEQTMQATTQTLGRFGDCVRAEPELLALVQEMAGGNSAEFGPVMTDLMQNMFAGIETTMASLCWAVINLGKNAAAQSRALETLSDGAENRDYLGTFVSESMRCMPPIPFVARRVTRDVTLGEHDLKEGGLILLSIVGVHRDPDEWSEPNAFIASRPEFLDAARPPRAYIPFLTGPRVCGGKRIAELEMVEALRLFLPRFEVTTEGAMTGFNYALAFRPELTQGVSLRRR